MTAKPRLASVWLDGCSGCHMSLLDIDERIIELAARVEFVWGPFVDMKKFPEQVDICLVEGAVATDEDIHKILMIRSHTKLLISFGDCAVTGNVPAMRNPFTVKSVMDRAYVENATLNQGHPNQVIPRLLPHACPVHEVVAVDLHLPGCPPSAETIWQTIVALLDGQTPAAPGVRFG